MSGIKFKPQDFRVRELLDPEYLRPSGKHRVYRVKKRKRTSLEAAQVLAELVGGAGGRDDVGVLHLLAHVRFSRLQLRTGLPVESMPMIRSWVLG